MLRPGRPDSKSDPLYRLYRGAAGKQRRIRARRAETADASAGHEAAICFEPETGNLDIMSKGGRETREGMARSFADRIMGSDQKLQQVHRRDFELDRLKSVMRFPTDPADN